MTQYTMAVFGLLGYNTGNVGKQSAIGWMSVELRGLRQQRREHGSQCPRNVLWYTRVLRLRRMRGLRLSFDRGNPDRSRPILPRRLLFQNPLQRCSAAGLEGSTQAAARTLLAEPAPSPRSPAG